MNVFAIKRSDKSLIELGEDVVGNLVALVLNGLNGLHLLGHARVVRKHLLKRFGSNDDIFSLFCEKAEETLFARQKALQKSRHFWQLPPEESMSEARRV